MQQVWLSFGIDGCAWFFFFNSLFSGVQKKHTKRILPVKTTSPKAQPTLSFLRLRMQSLSWQEQGEWMGRENEGMRGDRGYPSCLRPRLVPAHWFPLMTRGPEFLRLPWDNSCCHPQLLCRLWRGTWQQLSWLRYCLAEQQRRDGDRQACCASRVAKPAETLSSQLLPPNAKLAL